MTDKQIGKLVKEIREEKGIGREALARGLCSDATLFYFEKGKRRLDNLLMHRIFDRIGIDADEFAFMVTDEEYEYYLWKEHTFQTVEKQEWDELEILLENKKIALQRVYNKKIQYQYYYKLKAILKAERAQNYKQATELLGKAIQQTMPDIFTVQWDKLCLGETELHILLLYLYYGVKANKINQREQITLYERFNRYLGIEHMEEKKLAKLYPKFVAIWMHIMDLPVDEQKVLCEKAIQLLQETRRLHDILEVLRLYIEVLDDADEKLVFYRKQYENFCDIFQNADIDIGFHPEILAGRKEKLFLISEYLYTERTARGWTQQKISEGICEPETYSRIETGKHAPVKTSMYKFAEKLDIPWCYYRGEIVFSSLSAYRMYQKVRKCSNRGMREECLYWLKRLENVLDMTIVVNIQFIECWRVTTEYKLGKLSIEESYHKCEELLFLTTELPSEERFRYYTQLELEIMGSMGDLFCKQKRYEDGIVLLENVIKNQKKSKIVWNYQCRGLDYVLRILADLYFEAMCYEEANAVEFYTMKEILRRHEAISLPHALDGIADNYEHMGEKYCEIYKKFYCQTYYVADFFKFKKIVSFTKEYYEKNFDDEMKWY